MTAVQSSPAFAANEALVSAGDHRVVLLSAVAEQEWVEKTSGAALIRSTPEDWRIPGAWLAATLADSAARRRCAEWAAARLGCDVGALLHVSAPLLPSFAARLLTTGDDTARATERLCAEVLGWTGRVLEGDLSRWAAFAEITPAADLPCWVLDGRGDLAAALAQGDALALARLPIALRITAVQWQQFLDDRRRDRVATRWRIAPVIGHSEPHPAQPAREIPSAQTSEFLRRAAPAAEPLLHRASELITAEKARNAEAVSPAARSAAEALLHAVLQARPLTRDRFQLNAALDFAFGLRAAEGDLVDPSARMVVEIDGYYHFRDTDGYRRDRRKDAALQEHGWFVVRFLAEDTVCDLENVVARIEAHFARRFLARNLAP